MGQFFLVKLGLLIPIKYHSSLPPDVHLTHPYAMPHLMHTGSDYLVNIQNPSSRTFTVTFQSKQANSTGNGILLADDSILEGTETFLLRIVAARFMGQAATFFRAQDGLTNTVAEVIIEDDDCKFMNTTCIICLLTVTRGAYKHL